MEYNNQEYSRQTLERYIKKTAQENPARLTKERSIKSLRREKDVGGNVKSNGNKTE